MTSRPLRTTSTDCTLHHVCQNHFSPTKYWHSQAVHIRRKSVCLSVCLTLFADKMGSPRRRSPTIKPRRERAHRTSCEPLPATCHIR
jgi:hypothetical protein